MKRKHKVDLVVVTTEPFPIGMAATNRILSYTTEIAKQKKVLVLIAKPTEVTDEVVNVKSKGVVNNVLFKYAHNKTVWPKYSSKYHKLILILKSYYLILREFLIINPKTVLLISNDLKLIWILWFYSKIFKYNYFQEKSEIPNVLKDKKKFYYRFYKEFYLYSYRLFDGLVVMTNQLRSLFLSLKQKNIFVLPMTVDLDRFNKKAIKSNNLFIFKYSGGGNYKRDGLKIIIKAFIDLYKTNKNFEFHVIGPVDKQDPYLFDIFDTINKAEANKFIKFIGKKKSNDIPKLLFQANSLIMAPTTDFYSGGFPTKLGEYLATGLPVICTKVSEIPLYLNKNNSILVAPNNINDLLKAMEWVIKNPEKSLEIGKNGRLTAEKYFTAKTYVNNLINFLKL